MKKTPSLSAASLLSLFIRLAVIGFFSICTAQITIPSSHDGTFLDLQPEDFRRSQLLGTGSFGEVYKVQLDHQDYALKVATTTHRDHSISQLDNERRILQFLQENLRPAEESFFLLPPKKYGSIVSFKNPYTRRFVSGSGLLLPLCAYQIEGKSAELFDLIDNPKAPKLKPLHILQMALELAQALKALHRVGVIHGDIKPENVLFKGSKSSELSAVLVDFGSSWLVDERDSLVITHGYAAPERVVALSECVQDHNSQYCFSGHAGDVYSFAVLLVVMLKQDLKAINNINLSHADSSAIPITGDLHNLIERSLSNNPEDRPQIDELEKAIRKNLNQNPTKAQKNPPKSQYGVQFQRLLKIFENPMSSDKLTATRKQDMPPKSADKTEEDQTRIQKSNLKPLKVYEQQQKRTTTSIDAPNDYDHQNKEAVKMSAASLEEIKLNCTNCLPSSLFSRVKGTPWEKQIMWRNSKKNVKKSPRRMQNQSK